MFQYSYEEDINWHQGSPTTILALNYNFLKVSFHVHPCFAKDDKWQFQRLDIGLNNKPIISVLWENKFEPIKKIANSVTQPPMGINGILPFSIFT